MIKEDKIYFDRYKAEDEPDVEDFQKWSDAIY